MLHFNPYCTFKLLLTQMCNKGRNEAFGEKLFNFMLPNFRYFVLCHPTLDQTVWCNFENLRLNKLRMKIRE